MVTVDFGSEVRDLMTRYQVLAEKIGSMIGRGVEYEKK
jgi:hypothetical protein